jgi:DNA-binding MarR family transcriptional regulator
MPAQRGPRRDEMPADDASIAVIESALHSLARRLKQARLHDYICRQAGDGVDQAGLALLYALHGDYVLRGAEASLRITDVAAQLGIDAPAVTRKAQQLERLGLVSRARDADDARATRLWLTPEGRRVLTGLLLARHRWLATILADWPADDRREFARLICWFADGINRYLRDLDR